MFKVGDKIRIKKNINEIIREKRKCGKITLENYSMANSYAGKIGVIESISMVGSYRIFNYWWKDYSLEPVDINSISGYDLLL